MFEFRSDPLNYLRDARKREIGAATALRAQAYAKRKRAEELRARTIEDLIRLRDQRAADLDVEASVSDEQAEKAEALVAALDEFLEWASARNEEKTNVSDQAG